jgi:hypothetical protein
MDFLREFGAGTAQLKIALQVRIAMTLGAVVGYDREASDKPAGLRTHMLVAGGAAPFVGLGAIIAQLYNNTISGSRIQTDPIRVFEAIITGISFLGAGVKRGIVFGETDELGFNVVRDPVHVHDLNATILHLLGFDHTKLTYRFQGRDFRLTDVHGELVKGILA